MISQRRNDGGHVFYPPLGNLCFICDNPDGDVTQAEMFCGAHAYPDFDTVEAAGLDGTLRATRGELITWLDVINALNERKRCAHPHITREPADPSVGIMSACIWCEECGKDLSDDLAYQPTEYEGPWD